MWLESNFQYLSPYGQRSVVMGAGIQHHLEGHLLSTMAHWCWTHDDLFILARCVHVPIFSETLLESSFHPSFLWEDVLCYHTIQNRNAVLCWECAANESQGFLVPLPFSLAPAMFGKPSGHLWMMALGQEFRQNRVFFRLLVRPTSLTSCYRPCFIDSGHPESPQANHLISKGSTPALSSNIVNLTYLLEPCLWGHVMGKVKNHCASVLHLGKQTKMSKQVSKYSLIAALCVCKQTDFIYIFGIKHASSTSSSFSHIIHIMNHVMKQTFLCCLFHSLHFS